MLVSLEWLSEYVDISDKKPEEIAHALTMSGLEVEDIEKVGADFSNIVVAEILEIKPHPNADKLQLATVFNGTEKKDVVCGARNIAKGQLIPYATIGSEVKDRKSGEKFKLKPVSIRGVESQGMLCSADELGLESEVDGILILKDNPKPGEDIKKVLNIKDDIVLHVAPTANRGDQMSLIGIAREVSAIFNRELKSPATKSYDESSKPPFELKIHDTDACKYYAIGVLKDIKIGSSPDWIAARLLASGVRSINNVVDITNYVMLEYGQPLHAFDMGKLDPHHLGVRRAKQDETVVTLDETERKLTTDSVINVNKDKPVGLAGLMGGFNSEVDGNTTDIALESAYFVPTTTRKSSRSVGLRTEASARFERGVDIASVKPALIRAINLLEEYANARVEGLVQVGEDKLEDIIVTLRFNQIKRVLGIEIPEDKCIEILKNLGFEYLNCHAALDAASTETPYQVRGDKEIEVKIPSYRVNDVYREIDLIEEISRIYGYDKIETTLPRTTTIAQVSHETECINKTHKLMLAKGFNEAMTSSLIGEPLLKFFGFGYNDNEAIKVSNPQSDEYTMLRQSLIPSIAQVVKYNFDQGQKNIWIYELGKTYFFKGNGDEKNTGTEEKRVLAGAITGNITSSIWKQSQEPDFYTLKGVLELLIKEFKLDNRIKYQPAADVPYLHPGKAAQMVLLGKKSTVVGTFGELHPDINKKCKFNQPVYLFEVDFEALLQNVIPAVPRYKEIPHYPAVTRDIAFIIPENVSYQEITTIIKKSSSKLFQKADIFDLYKGEHVPQGSKSIAIRVTLQDPTATLTDEIIDAEVSKIKNGLKTTHKDIAYRE